MALSKIELSELLSVYGGLLTEKQRDAVTMYCNCDLSLGEIADESGISRQGVRDAIVKSENTLVKLENELRLSEFITEARIAVDKDDVTLLKEVVKRFVSKE